MQFGRSGAITDRDRGFCITITNQATHRLLCSNSSPRKTFLSSPDHRTLRVSLRVTLGCSQLVNRPQENMFRNHEGHQIKWDGRTPEDSERSLLPVHSKMAESLEQVCVCVVCPTVTVKCHHSGNVFTARLTALLHRCTPLAHYRFSGDPTPAYQIDNCATAISLVQIWKMTQHGRTGSLYLKVRNSSGNKATGDLLEDLCPTAVRASKTLFQPCVQTSRVPR
jgi:hypothetical protein